MRERVAQILKIVCFGLAALLLVQLVKVAYHANPLSGASIPQVPSLPADTNAAPPANVANKPPGKSGTNSPVMANGTNSSTVVMNTNAPGSKKSKAGESNAGNRRRRINRHECDHELHASSGNKYFRCYRG